MSNPKAIPPRRRSRDPGTGAKCTHCGAVGDEKFGRYRAYGTLKSWCKACERVAKASAWRKTHPDAKPRQDGVYTVLDKIVTVMVNQPQVGNLFDNALVLRAIALVNKWRTRRRR